MEIKITCGIIVFLLAFAMATVSAQYPTVVDSYSGSNALGPIRETGCFHSFIVDAPRDTYQTVQVVVGGVAYDMVYDNAAWRASICVSSGQTYFYRITTRHGVKFESSVQKV